MTNTTAEEHWGDIARELLADEPPTRLGGTWEALIKPGLGGRERWRWTPDGDDRVLYVKRYLRTPMRDQVDRMRRQNARHSRAWWEHHQSEGLNKRYVSAVKALAAAEDMCGGYERRSAVIFERVPGDGFDRAWSRLVEQNAPLTRGAARHETTRALARFVSAFHQTGVCHRDLYLCHIFTELDPTAHNPPRFTLIDLARTHKPRLRRLRWIIKDLSQLDCSARQIGATCTDRLRFLITYLGLFPDAPRLRVYARRIVRKSNRILRRIERKSRQA